MKTMLLTIISAAALMASEHNEAGTKQITVAMENLKKAMIGKDGAALEKLLHKDLMYTHSAGQVETKAEVIKAVVSGKANIEKLEFTAPIIRIYGNTAFFKGRTDLYHSATNIVNMDVLHVWIKGPDGWQLAARQATRLAK